jgi:hypothetical protein
VADDSIEPAPLDSLHGVVAQPTDLADIENRHDMGVMQSGGGAGLVQEAAARR